MNWEVFLCLEVENMGYFRCNQKIICFHQAIKKRLEVECRFAKRLIRCKAGNRIRTIESYDYIFSQFVESTSTDFVEDLTVDNIYNYLDSRM